MRKSIIAALMSFVVAISGGTNGLKIEAQTLNQANYYILREDGSRGTATVEEIDRMVFERNRAIISGDKEEETKIQQAIYDAGVYPSTEEELKPFFSDNRNDFPDKGTSSVSYDTTYYTVTAGNGIVYEIKRIITHPTTSSNLFHSAAVNNKTISSSVAAGAYQLCKVTGTLVSGYAYSVFNAFITAYDALHSIITGFSASTVVYNITASYACAALEQVSFYQYKNGSYWTPFASSSYIQTGFSSTIFSTNYSGGSQQGLNMNVSQQQDTLYSTYSLTSTHTGYNTADILNRYFSTYIFDKKSQVTSVSFFHNANGVSKHIKSLGMLCPTTLSDIS